MPAVEIRPARRLPGRRLFVDVPFRIHGGDPGWVPPLRLTVYDRLSPRHPAMQHQEVALWLAYRHGRPVGRIGACIDRAFNDYQKARWGWVGFFDSFDDPMVAGALFETACAWAGARGAEVCVGPASFTTNDELGLLVDGFDDPPALLTLQNPRYYERLWVDHGWEPAIDLWGWAFDHTTELSDRQRRTLERIERRARVRVRSIRMDDYDAEVGRFFEVYNAAWQDNWGFAPMPEAEIRHLAGQLKQIINPNWAFGLETPEGQVVGVCLALPDVNQLMRRVRSGRLLPFGWFPLLTGRRQVRRARVWALGIRPDYQHLALGPILYREIVDRLLADGIGLAEASWTLASNHRINDQMAAMGARRSKVWRLYRRPPTA
jgi:ribosomal protein S18 acetylase RimI-like enzyme